MSFLKKLFGAGSDKNKKPILEDNELGTFQALGAQRTSVIWQGTTDFMGQPIALLIGGDQDQLDQSQKKKVLAILKNQLSIEAEVNSALKDEYTNADKSYSNWKEHFNCISISSSSDELSLAMEEHDSFYHFNIYFENNKAVGVSIDS